MKYKLLATSILALLSIGRLNAQEQGGQEKNLYIKGNALLVPIGIFNLGAEKQMSSRYTLQGDLLISPWKSFAGHKLQFYSISAEGRYYFDEAFRHWYVGTNLALAVYNASKWTYWNNNITQNWNGEMLVNSNLYQKGFSVILGVTAGYQFQLSERWNLDLYATVGTSQAFYKGYDKSTGRRYDSANRYNKSGEIIPYRGGVMIAYTLK